MATSPPPRDNSRHVVVPSAEQLLGTPPYTIRGIERVVARVHSLEYANDDHAFILYSNGKVTFQKGGELLWQRSEFTLCVPITRHFTIAKLPLVKKPELYYANVSEQDALAVRKAMMWLYFGHVVEEPSDFERLLGGTLADIVDYPNEKERARLHAKRNNLSEPRSPRDDGVVVVVKKHRHVGVNK